jgi:phosphoglycerate dehydrogenase-like enzyme
VSEPSVLILGEDSGALADLIAESAESTIPLTACSDVAAARAAYSGQAILFGDPESISEVLTDMPAVEWVQSTWAGVTPLLKLARRDYLLTGIKGVFGPQMTEYVLGYMLAHELRIPARLVEQRAHQWRETASGTLQGRKIGIMGTGSIGSAIASRATENGMVATGLNRSGAANSNFEKVYSTADLVHFLSELDYLVSVLPDTPETDNLLNEKTLASLPARACFINVGRANVVKVDALIMALNNKQLGAAVLDVFDEEPVPEDSPLWDTPNLLMTPHIAARSYPELIVPIFLSNYQRFASGQALDNLISFEHGY